MCKKQAGQLLMLSVLALALGGCGQKGDLWLPQQDRVDKTTNQPAQTEAKKDEQSAQDEAKDEQGEQQ